MQGLLPLRGASRDELAEGCCARAREPGSTWEIRATPANGGSRVKVIGVRQLKGFKGRLLAPAFPLGLAKRTVAEHLRHLLSQVEKQASEAR